MAVVAAGELDQLGRPVAALASRAALMVASVPELTMRSFSTAGTRRATSSASSTSASVGAPNEVPRAVAACTASTTRGWACPAISGPHEQTRST